MDLTGLLGRWGFGATGGNSSLDGPGPVPILTRFERDPAPSLRVAAGAETGAQFYLRRDRALTVGSGRNADLPADGLDGAHCRLTWTATGLKLTATGCDAKVNGAAFSGRALSNGDRLQLGPLALTVHVPAGTVEQAPPKPAEERRKPIPAEAPPATPLNTTTTTSTTASAAAPRPPQLPLRQPVARPMPRPTPAARPMPSRGRARGKGRWIAIAAVATLAAAAGGWAIRARLTRPPVLSSIEPSSGFADDEIQLSGDAFATSGGQAVIRIGETQATVIVASPTLLRAKVPQIEIKAIASLPVTVETGHGRSQPLQFQYRIRPRWDAVEPSVAPAGGEIKLTGGGFDNGEPVVLVGGRPAAITSRTPSEILVRIPELPDLGSRDPVSVTLRVGQQALAPKKLWIGQLPYLLEVEPRRALPGAKISVSGFGFDPAPGATRAYVAGVPALVLSAKPNALELSVPSLRKSAMAAIEVEVGGARSSIGPRLDVEATRTGSYRLRFLAAPAESRPAAADVVTEFAPVLRLASRSSAADLPARARAVAAALNEQVSRAATGEVVEFEARTRGSDPTLAVVNGDALTPVEPEDAAEYGKNVERAVVAQHWSDLLNDYFVLFLRRDRPSRLAARSTSGKAMIDLQSAVGLRARGSALYPDAPDRVSSELSSRLGRMALELPKTSVNVVSLLEGIWEGFLEEGVGPRQTVTLTLAPKGAGLQGSLRRVGKSGALDQAVQDVKVEKDQLSFRISLGNQQRVFSGTLAGSLLSGVIKGADGAEQGRFELRLRL